MHSPTHGDARQRVPVNHKLLLTLEEAAAYMGVGINHMREISHDPDFAEEVVCLVGRRRMFRRQRLEEYVYDWGGLVPGDEER